MKFTLTIGALTDAVAQASGTLDQKGAEASGSLYLASVRRGEIQRVYFYSTNFLAETLIKIDALVEEEGEVLVDPDQVLGGLAHRDKDALAEIATVSHGANSERVRVKTGSDEFRMNIDSRVDGIAKRVHSLPFKSAPSLTMQGDDMMEFIRRSLFCVPKHEDIPQGNFSLGGMSLAAEKRGYTVLATDGSIVGRIRIKAHQSGESAEGILIPQQSLSPLNRLVSRRKAEQIELIPGPACSSGQPGKAYFRMGDVLFGTALLSGRFPNLGATIDEQKPAHWIAINRAHFKASLERAASFDEASRNVDLALKGNHLHVSAHSEAGDLEDWIEVVKVTGPDLPVKTTVNLDYLSNIASGSTCDELKIGIGSKPVHPIFITDDEDKKIISEYALMPIHKEG